jgi:DNA-binding transcriptional LysR family regulator
MERPLNFRQLEAFRAVMLAGSMTKAGQIMNISQPAVTRLIRDLEHDLRLPLFHRHGAQIAPTDEGQRLYREVQRHFAGTERIRDAARSIRESSAGYLHIGAMPNLSVSCLPEAVGTFLREFPQAVVSVHPDNSLDLVEMISHGQLDVAFAVVPEDRRDIDHDPFPVSEAVCVMPPGHRLAAKPFVSVGDLDGEDFVSLGLRSVLRMQVNAAMLAAGVRPRVRLETVHSPTVISYVRQGAGIAVIDPFAAMGPGAGELVVKRFVPAISLRFSAVYREMKERSPLALAFSDILRGTLLRALERQTLA